MAHLIGIVDEGRAVLVMTGSDARTVLQGVVTNDVDDITPGRAVYAALLTPQGKYLFDFFLLDGGEGTVLIDVAADRAAALAQRLSMYCLRRDARVAPQTELGVALIWPVAQADDVRAPAVPSGAILVADPRAPALGWRIYAPDAAVVLSALDVGQANRAAYDALRVAHRIPASGVELLPEATFILEAGFERLAGVDFRKGCFVGQEVTARMKHKAELRRGLVQVRVSGAAEPGTPITADGKPAGTLFSVVDGKGLAELRLDRAGQGMEAGEATVDYPA